MTSNLVTRGLGQTNLVTAGLGYRGLERGGRGIQYPRRKVVGKCTIFIYHAEAFFDNTLQIKGSADVIFVPAPKFDIYKELQHEFEKHPTPQAPTTFMYVAEPGGITIGGQADEDYFDFENFIVTYDDDIIIADILSTANNPFIITTFDTELQKLHKDDDEVIEILELL